MLVRPPALHPLSIPGHTTHTQHGGGKHVIQPETDVAAAGGPAGALASDGYDVAWVMCVCVYMCVCVCVCVCL